MSLSNLVHALRSLKQTKTKIDIYHRLADLIPTIQLTTSQRQAVKYIVQTINTDILSDSAQLQQAAFETLEAVFRHVNETEFKTSTAHLKKAVALLPDKNGGSVSYCVETTLRTRIMDGNLGLEEIVASVSDTELIEKMSVEIEKICGQDKERGIHVLLTEILPLVFTTSAPDVRIGMINVAFRLIETLPIALLSTDKIAQLKRDIKDKYIPKIEELRKNGDHIWCKLWSFLVRYLQKQLHTDLELMNSILRIVEYAFRSAKDRLVSYDCWKELMDNYSLDSSYIASSKHIRLLTTPLKANLSKADAVFQKRFELFVYLLRLLKNDAVKCLDMFLTFCFGPFVSENDAKVTSNCRKFPKMFAEALEVFTELLGHNGHDSSCAVRETDRTFVLKKPVVTPLNYMKYNFSNIVNSVVECCVLLETWTDKDVQIVVTKCLWGSVFNLVAEMPLIQEDLMKLCTILSNTAKSYEDHKFVTLAFDSLISSKIDKNTFNEVALMPLLKSLLPLPNLRRTLLKLVDFACENGDDRKFLQHSMPFFAQDEWRPNVEVSAEVWLRVAGVLERFCGTCTPSQRNGFDDDVISFLLFPAYELHTVTEDVQLDTLTVWSNLREKLTRTLPNCTQNLIRQLRRVLGEEQRAVRSVSKLLRALVTNENEDLRSFSCVEELLVTLSELLGVPIHVDPMAVLDMMQVCRKVVVKGLGEEDQVQLAKEALYKCLMLFLPHCKTVPVLDFIALFLKELHPCARSTLCELLHNNILELTTDLDETISKSAIELLNKLSVSETEIPTKHSPFSRNSRLLEIVKKQKNTSPATPKVKGSLLNNNVLKAKKEAANVSDSLLPKRKSLMEEDSRDFVTIDAEPQLDIGKMNRHQREVMRRRRDDIPSLYQDLSQDTQQSGSFQATEDLFTETEPPKGPENDDYVIEDLDSSSGQGKEVVVQHECVKKTKRGRRKKQTVPLEVANGAPTKTAPESGESLWGDVMEDEEKKKKVQRELEKLKLNLRNPDQFVTNERTRRKSSQTDTEEFTYGRRLRGVKRLSLDRIPGTPDRKTTSKRQKSVATEPPQGESPNIIQTNPNDVNVDIAQASAQENLNELPTNSMHVNGNECDKTAPENSKTNLQTETVNSNLQKPEPRKRKRSNVHPKKKRDNLMSSENREIPTKEPVHDDFTPNFIEASPKTINNPASSPSSPSNEENTNQTPSTASHASILKQIVFNSESSVITEPIPGDFDEWCREISKITGANLDKPVETAPTKIKQACARRKRSKSECHEVEVKRSPSTRHVRRGSFTCCEHEVYDRSGKKEKNVWKASVRVPSVCIVVGEIQKQMSKGRRNKLVLSESTEVIESSQESIVDILPVGNGSALKSVGLAVQETLDGGSEEIVQTDENVTQPQPQASNDLNDTLTCDPYAPVPEDITASPKTIPSNRSVDALLTTGAFPFKDNYQLFTNCFDSFETDQNKQKQALELAAVIHSLPPQKLNFDLPFEHVEEVNPPPLTHSEKDIFEVQDKSEALPDTLTARESDFMCEETDLPGSPVTVETPTRTCELLSGTSGISPIRVSPNVQTGDVRCESPEKSDSTKSPVKEDSDDETNFLRTPSHRSVRLLNLLKVNVRQSPTGTAECFVNAHSNGVEVFASSPKTGRVKRMMANLVKGNELSDEGKSPEVEDGKLVYNGEEEVGEFLTFQRELPSPLATPRGGSILKRKLDDRDCAIGEGLSPCAKRKKVNFSDPPTTSKKLYLKEDKKQQKKKAAKETELLGTEGMVGLRPSKTKRREMRKRMASKAPNKKADFDATEVIEEIVIDSDGNKVVENGVEMHDSVIEYARVEGDKAEATCSTNGDKEVKEEVTVDVEASTFAVNIVAGIINGMEQLKSRNESNDWEYAVEKITERLSVAEMLGKCWKRSL